MRRVAEQVAFWPLAPARRLISSFIEDQGAVAVGPWRENCRSVDERVMKPCKLVPSVARSRNDATSQSANPHSGCRGHSTWPQLLEGPSHQPTAHVDKSGAPPHPERRTSITTDGRFAHRTRHAFEARRRDRAQWSTVMSANIARPPADEQPRPGGFDAPGLGAAGPGRESAERAVVAMLSRHRSSPSATTRSASTFAQLRRRFLSRSWGTSMVADRVERFPARSVAANITV